jgi:myosin heavy subunit
MQTEWSKFAQTQAKSQSMSSESITPTGSSSNDSERNRQLELQVQRLLNLLKDKDTELEMKNAEIEKLHLKIEQLEKQQLEQSKTALSDEKFIVMSNSVTKAISQIDSLQQNLKICIQTITRLEQKIREGSLLNQSLTQENQNLCLENQLKQQENDSLYKRLVNYSNISKQYESTIRQLKSTINQLQQEKKIIPIQNDNHIEQIPSMHFEPERYNSIEGERNMSMSFPESESLKGRIPTGYQESSNKTYSHRMNMVEIESHNKEEISKLQKQIEYLTQLVYSLIKIKQPELNTEQVPAYTTPQQALDGLKEFLARS